MQPTSSSIYWAACLLTLTCDPYDVDAAPDVRLNTRGFPREDLLYQGIFEEDDGWATFEIVIRMRVVFGEDPYQQAMRRVVALSRDSFESRVEEMYLCRQTVVLAKFDRPADCDCGPAHRPRDCAACDTCLTWAAMDLLLGENGLGRGW